jgi:hypothetical protein
MGIRPVPNGVVQSLSIDRCFQFIHTFVTVPGAEDSGSRTHEMYEEGPPAFCAQKGGHKGPRIAPCLTKLTCLLSEVRTEL